MDKAIGAHGHPSKKGEKQKAILTVVDQSSWPAGLCQLDGQRGCGLRSSEERADLSLSSEILGR
jgi:hypothetical protein